MFNRPVRLERALPRAFRLWLILGLVLLQLVAVGALLISSHVTSQGVLLAHMQEILVGAADRSEVRTLGFLDPAVRTTELTAALLETSALDVGQPDQVEQFFFDVMDANPEFDGIYFGGADGSFTFVNRDFTEPEAVYRLKVVERDVNGNRSVSLSWRDTEHRELSARPDPQDSYDPRGRPWYVSAAASDEPVWTDPYMFFSSQQPGITVAEAVHKDGQLVGVVGVDIDLSALASFLGSLDIGERGSAFIVDEEGQLIAYSDLIEGSEPVAPVTGSDPIESWQVDSSPTTASEAAYAAFVAGGGAGTPAASWTREFSHGGEVHQAAFVPFEIDEATTWIIGVHAPEKDFLGGLRDNERTNVYLGVAISIVLAGAGLWIARRVLAPMNELQGIADTDQLTGLANRRHLLDAAAQLATQAAVRGRPITVAMVDVDNFKVINDTHGHALGDEVLVALAGRLQHAVREGDLLARYGGEEFTIVMPDTDLGGAFAVVDRLRSRVAETPIRTTGGLIQISLSAGVAELSSDVPDFDSLLHEADKALYRAKDLGRNCVVAAGI